MITGAQIRAARALLQWTSHRVARYSKLCHVQILKAEAVNDVPALPDTQLAAIKAVFENAGIEFIGIVGVKVCRPAIPFQQKALADQ